MNDLYIPQALKVMANWCTWKLEQRNGRMTKVPYQTNGRRASSTDRNTWSTFDLISELLASDNQYNGYGFMLSDGIVFVDIDCCVADDGTMDERGADILSAFPLSFAEISQSGKGLHILTRGNIPRNFHNQKQGVEMYSYARFCAITGHAIQALEPTQEQDGINYVFNKYGTRNRINSNYTLCNSNNTDRWVIAHASAITGEKGRNFRTLFFDGDISAYGSQSEADEALCILLAFWCDRDPNQMDRLFRQSGLYRAKWEREDYRNRTILHACQHIPESISEWTKRRYIESCQSASSLQILEFGKRDDSSE